MNAQQLLDLIATADAVMVDGGPLLSSWNTADVTGTPDNEVLFFSWEDQDGTYSLTLTEDGIAAGKWDEKKRTYECFDEDGDPTTVQMFKLQCISEAPRPERVLLQLPSCEGTGGEYDLLAYGPPGWTEADAVARVALEIKRANEEDARNETGCCDDGLSVEASIKAALTLDGFTFVKPAQTVCWDEAPH